MCTSKMHKQSGQLTHSVLGCPTRDKDQEGKNTGSGGRRVNEGVNEIERQGELGD